MDDRYSLVIEIDVLPSCMLNSRKHWRENHKEAKQWDQIVHLKSFGKKPMSPLKKAGLTLTRYSSSKMDWDNLASTWKHPVDALVTNGILHDDCWDVIGMPVFQHKLVPRGRGKIRIEILELP